MQRQLTDLLQEGAWHGILLCVLVVLFLFFPRLWGRCRHRERASERRHRRYRAAAERVLTKLPEGGAGVKYLRKINPYVFEELLLLAFERRGMAVIRNTR